MPRTDSASRIVTADPDRLYAALVDPDALTQWLPPSGMSGRFDSFDPRPGGGYRMTLTYDDPAQTGKSGDATDVVDATFVELTPGVRVVQSVVFEADDPRFAGTMRMTWELHPVDGGTEVVFRADDVPDGISAEDHATGMNASLDNLASYVAQTEARG